RLRLCKVSGAICMGIAALPRSEHRSHPPSYAKISPSGIGIKLIACASGKYARKTKQCELYSSKRFFTITGNVLSGHEAITTAAYADQPTARPRAGRHEGRNAACLSAP